MEASWGRRGSCWRALSVLACQRVRGNFPGRPATYVSARCLGVGGGNRVGCCGGVSFGVVDCCQRLLLVRCRADSAEVGAHPVGTCRLAGSFYQDIGALTDAENHHLGLVRDHGDEVVGNDRHGVAVDGEELRAFGAGVDKAKVMHLSGLKAEFRDCGVGRAALTGGD